ncbi:hypothetical protein [Legionella birminghamensis]|uniref:Uncharacterized protein n=3 Tax=Legionella birminghamensis TaxID=28083 RepID=A0A378IB34_9GAMM|nr:hypothetical protein [Legionella birminghamensis]STX32447.1 Uncharacterised protein [Legionella birminghamensis]
MLTALQLLEYFSNHVQSPVIAHPDLNPETKKIMEAESTSTFFYFKSITVELARGLNQQEAITQIRYFLKRRWEFIKKTNWAYTRHPFLPANQLCLQVAEQIAGKDEAVCQILMPGTRKISRKTDSPFSFKDETEEDGHFPVHKYLLAASEGELLSLEDIYSAGVANTNSIFPDFQESTAEIQYLLKSIELWNVKQAAGNSSIRLMDELFRFHKQQYDDSTLGFAIKNLARHAYKASKEDAGTETVAEMKLLEEAIREFYAIWRALSRETKKELFQMKLEHYGSPRPLPLYFFALFVRLLDCPLTKAEFSSHKGAQILNCAHIIANTLEEFLKQHPRLFNIPNPLKTHAANTQQGVEPLSDLLSHCLEALEKRGQTLEIQEPNLFKELAFSIYSNQRNDTFMTARIIAYCVSSFQDLIDVIDLSEDLFKGLIPLIRQRTQQFKDSDKLFKLLEKMTAQVQQLLLTEEFFPHIYKHISSYSKFTNIYFALAPNLQEKFKTGFVKELIKEVHDVSCVVRIANQFSSTLIIPLLFEELQTFLSNFFNGNVDSFLGLYKQLHSTSQNCLAELFLDSLSQWLSPDNFNEYKDFLDLPLISLARVWSEEVNSFTEYLALLDKWSRHPDLISDFNTVNASKLASWIMTEEDLDLLLEKMPVKSWIPIFNYAKVISSWASFQTYWQKISPFHRSDFLDRVNLKTFIKTIENLQLLLNFVNKDKHKQRVLSRFKASDLNCSEEELAALRPPSRMEQLEQLLNKFSRCTDANEMLEAVRKLQNSIASEYQRGPRRGQIQQTLQGAYQTFLRRDEPTHWPSNSLHSFWNTGGTPSTQSVLDEVEDFHPTP